MSTKAIIIANQTQARFLVWDNSAPPEESNHPLQDIQTLDNPITTTSGKEVWANLQSGRNRGTSSQAHGYDDHRQNHLDEFERRFCNAIATQALALIDQYKIRTVILAAPPQVLGSLRRETEVLWPTTLNIQELTKDLVKLSSSEIKKYLVAKELIPATVKAV